MCIDGGKEEGLQLSLRDAFSLLEKGMPASEAVVSGPHSVFCPYIVLLCSTLPYQ